MRPTYAEIDLSAIRANVTALAGVISPSELCAVVKADAYGHGDVPVAMAALESGASSLAVALVSEGVRLREAGIEAPVLILSEPDATSIPDLAAWGLIPTVYSVGFAAALSGAGVPGAHVKIDTGMHRVGAAPRLVHDILGALSNAGVGLEGVWTHFPVADEDPEFTRQQVEVFDAAIEGLDAPVIHMANTAAACSFPETRRDMCRIGLGIYGLHPNMETMDVVDLTPAMRVVSHVSHIQRLEAGARPSYGRRRPLAVDATVATIPIGYADGFARGLSTYGCVLIGGHRFPLAGTITMDQSVVDVGDADVGLGDEVVLLGRQGSEEIKAGEWAEELETITYEVVCGIGPRVPRRYRD